MKKRKWIAAVLVSALLFVVLSYTAGWLLMPPRQSYGSIWSRYLQEPEDSIDVLYLGSSLVYCNIVPSVIWEDTGITSYLMTGPEQTVPFTYSYFKEACRTQSPKVIAIEITGMFYTRYCSYSKINAGYMPWSANRIAATFAAAEPELRAGLLFPLFDYHSRWREVTPGNIKEHLDPPVDPNAGYTFLTDSRPQGDVTYRDYSAETENYERNLEYLKKIHAFCQKEDIQLVLLLTPTKGRIPDTALAALKLDISALDGAEFIDFNDHMAELNIDDSTDWYDFLHFNCRGAEKFSHFMGQYLTGTLGLAPTEGEDEALWQSRVDTFHTRRSAVT